MSDSKEFKAHIAGVFSRASSSYDRTGPRAFSFCGERLVANAGMAAGHRVLDVASGRGAVLIPAARQVSPSGRAVGIDLAAGMVEGTRAALRDLGFAWAEVLEMDAERLDFPDAGFDTVLSGFGLFFLPDLPAALAGFSRVLVPGGLLAFSTFSAEEKSGHGERWERLYASFKDRLAPRPSAKTVDLESRAEIEQVLSAAGFLDIEITEEDHAFSYGNAEEWWQAMWSHGFRAFLERLDAAALEEFRAKAFTLLHEEGSGDGRGIQLPWKVLYTKARNPR